MRVDGFAAFAFCILGLLFSGPALAAERGVVVEEVGAGSALEKAGVRHGDVLYAWERLPSPPANPEGAKGEIASPFDWLWVEIEEAPRGVVRLVGEREGQGKDFQVSLGVWSAVVRPRRLPAELPEEAGDATLACWVQLKTAEESSERGQSDAAAASYRAALAAAPDPLSRSVVQTSLGAAHRSQSEHEEARQAFLDAAEIQRETWGETLSLARSEYELGVLALEQGKLDEAQEHYEKALAIQQELAPESLEVARSIDDLGVVAWTRGQVDVAAVYNERALKIRERQAPGSLEVGESFNNLGVVAWARGDLDTASKLLAKAFTIMEKWQPGGLDSSYALNNLGAIALARGELVMAEEYFSRALEIREKLDPESLAVTISLQALGALEFERGSWSLSEEYSSRALVIQERLSPGTLRLAVSLNNLGASAQVRGALEAAFSFHRRALEIREQLAPESLDLAFTLSNLSTLALQHNDAETAWKYATRALEIQEKVAPESLDMGLGLERLGAAAAALGRLEAAANQYQHALRIREQNAPQSRIEAKTLHALGETSYRMQQPARAIDFYYRALDVLERQIGKLGGSQEDKARFRSLHRNYYHDAIDLLFELGRRDDAFHALERSRARSLLTLLAERDLVFAIDISPELEREQRQLSVLYDRTQKQIFDLPADAEASRLEALLRELRRLRTRSTDIAEEIRGASPKLAALQYPEPLDLDGARQTLDPGTILLSYSVGEDETHLFAVTTDSELRALELPIGEEELRAKIGLFRDLIAQARPDTRHGKRRLEDLDREARELYRTLLLPVAEEIERGERLLILPDGPLHLLPWSALVRPLSEDGDGEYLVEWKPHHVALSATVYAELRRERPNEEPSGTALLTAFGDPVYPPRFADAGTEIPDVRVRAAAERGFGFEPLPGTRREVEGIAALYGEDAAVYLGADATEERAKSTDAATRYLHFATHGVLDERFPLNSGLALTIPEELAEGRDNGLLQAWEIFESVRLDADLVVLSACESALGQEVGGEGLVGLTRAFQYAGARSVLASLWQVADESTAVLMERFYGHLKAGKPKDEALRAAQLDLLRGPLTVAAADGESHELDAAAPYAWAAFQLHGDWR